MKLMRNVEPNRERRTAVVIPAYNAASYLSATLDGLFAQTRTDWVLVVVDDGSTDATAEIARARFDGDPRARLVQQPNGGLSAARNRGAAVLDDRCDAVLFLDADDVLEPGALETLSECLEACPTAPAVHGLARFIDGAGEPWRQGEAERHTRARRGVEGHRLIDWPLERPTSFAVLAYRNFIWSPGQVLIRREALRRVGEFDPMLSAVADWDLWLRLARLGDLAFIDQTVLGYRRHETNMSQDLKRMRTAEYLLRRKLLNTAELTAEQKRTARIGWRCSERFHGRLNWRLAKGCLRKGQSVTAAKLMVRGLERYIRGMGLASGG